MDQVQYANAIAKGLSGCRRIYLDGVYPLIQEDHSLLFSSLRNWKRRYPPERWPYPSASPSQTPPHTHPQSPLLL